MFWLNHSCHYCWIDWPNLESPRDICAAILEHTNATLIILGADHTEDLHQEYQFSVYDQRITGRDSVYEGDFELRRALATAPSLFDDVFISGNSNRISIANESAVGTILVTENPSTEDAMVGPDVLVTEEQLGLLLRNDFFGGLHGETAIFPDPSLLPGYSPQGLLRVFPYHFRTGFAYLDSAYSFGRFLRLGDALQRRHHFTRYLWRAKYVPARTAKKFGRMLGHYVPEIVRAENLENTIMTWIPKKPCDAVDRNQILLSKVNEFTPFGEDIEIECLLSCPADFPTQKSVSNFADKRTNVRDKFVANRQIDGNDIILFDDIFTSGSTLRECAKILRDAGAGKVVAVTLGITCHESPSSVPPLTCAGCGTALQLQFRKSDGGAFWGCPNYKNTEFQHPIVNFTAGIKAIRAMQAKLNDPNFPF